MEKLAEMGWKKLWAGSIENTLFFAGMKPRMLMATTELCTAP